MLALAALAIHIGRALASPDIPQFEVDGKTYPGWTDADITPPKAEKVMRLFPLGNPWDTATGFVSVNQFDNTYYDWYVCTSEGSPERYNTTKTAPIRAGGIVNIPWTGWGSAEQSPPKGPVLNYMAKCPKSGCSGWAANYPQTPWFKISHDGLDADGVWATTKIFKNHTLKNPKGLATIKIPTNLAPGDYLLRHEMIDLKRQIRWGDSYWNDYIDFFPGKSFTWLYPFLI
ncbi:hypothetical protein D9611_014357 [Ephemerocybe angulata]|uniref:lytic cellulose monooxygenase (C4-dehydrogenating) n=1 Tax=Ephemerocybe angulata TaxID=980116 RepID=A0A8H5B7Q5_9AGAR|nr:hypothetical protein D9611_014357 [Tulosesus angulatus]